MMDRSLTYHQEVALIFRDRLPSDIIPHLITVLKGVVEKDARDYYVQRLNPVNRWPVEDQETMKVHSLLEWLDVNRKQAGIIQDIRILNEPRFWERIVYDTSGLLINRHYVEGYSYRVALRPWCKPVKRHLLQKVMLLNKESTKIQELWYKKLQYPDPEYVIPFIIIYYDTNDSDEADHEEWILDPTIML